MTIVRLRLNPVPVSDVFRTVKGCPSVRRGRANVSGEISLSQCRQFSYRPNTQFCDF